MKRTLLFIIVCLTAVHGFAQKNAFTEEDVKQFYSTIQGDYQTLSTDSVNLSLHLTPIWEHNGGPYRWLYLEALENETQNIVEQRILEVVPLSNITFKVVVHGLRHPELFVGKWSNPSFFDGYNDGILKGNDKYMFLKTKDFEYQTNWNGRKTLKCFPSGDRIHYKFVQEDGRFYIKRLLRRTSHLTGVTFFKAPTD